MSQKEWSTKPGSGHNQRLLKKEHHCGGFGEAAGGTTAGGTNGGTSASTAVSTTAAVAGVVCFPLTLVHLISLAVVKFPAGLCKKTLKQIKRKVKAKKQVRDKPANDEEETVCEEPHGASSRNEFLSSSDACALLKAQMLGTR